MLAIATLKSTRTREKKSLIKEKTEVSKVLQADWTDNPQELLKLSLSVGQTLNLETKLTRLEAANDKLVEALEQAEDDKAMQQFQTTLDEESELTDDTISKISQLKVMKEEVERKCKEIQDRDLENRASRVQEQVDRLQSTQSSSGLSTIWGRPADEAPIKPPQLDLMETYLSGKSFGTPSKPLLIKVGTHWLTR